MQPGIALQESGDKPCGSYRPHQTGMLEPPRGGLYPGMLIAPTHGVHMDIFVLASSVLCPLPCRLGFRFRSIRTWRRVCKVSRHVSQLGQRNKLQYFPVRIPGSFCLLPCSQTADLHSRLSISGRILTSVSPVLLNTKLKVEDGIWEKIFLLASIFFVTYLIAPRPAITHKTSTVISNIREGRLTFTNPFLQARAAVKMVVSVYPLQMALGE